VQACRQGHPHRAWLDGLDHCVETARLYNSAAVGIDLLFESGYMRHFVLEVNAFGDFFPNLVDEKGRSVARVEIEATARAARADPGLILPQRSVEKRRQPGRLYLVHLLRGRRLRASRFQQGPSP